MKKTMIAIAATIVASAALAQEKPAPAGDVARGLEKFSTIGCWQCHGIGGGGSQTGPRLAKTVLSYEAFANQLRHPASDMPPYEASVATDQTVADLYAYVKSRPEAPELKNLPLLQKSGIK